MITDAQVVAMFAKANPVPSLDLLDPVEAVNLAHLEDRSERSREMSDLETLEKGTESSGNRSRGLLVAAAVAVVVLAIGIGVFTASRGPQIAATPLDRATAFWVAVVNADRDTAVAHVDPAAAGVANIHGRAHTLDDQFDWYEAVGFEWSLDECIETDQGQVECTVAGSNDWSDALGVQPVTGIYVMEVGESGITEIVDKDDQFLDQWSPLVFEVFADWVATKNPADAQTMFDFEVDVDQEILDLYELYTDRFVEAHTEG